VVGVSLSYPLGQSNEEANYARARLARVQATERLKGSQGRSKQQVRDAAYKIEMNAKRIETTRAASNLAEQRLDAEQKRFEVGLSTSFLVIQAQRDLAQAKANEVSAVLAYDLALVDFEELQEAGPSGPAGASSAADTPAQQPATTVTALPAAAAAAAGARPATVVGVPGF
jgi:outer membrane protein TolC